MPESPNGPVLLIMAAGAARRYGGLKQLAPVGPAGEAIMEYSLHDALAAGFSKAVLVIRPEFEGQFREKFVDRARQACEIAFAYQQLDSCVPERHKPVEREKPWGTGHAVLCARQHIDRPFAVINADDYYGPNAFEQMGKFLASIDAGQPMQAAMIGYELRNTLSAHGTVSRGVCETTPDGMLSGINERHSIAPEGDDAVYTDPDGGRHTLSGDTTVSMNLWGYPAEIFEPLGQRFEQFLDGPRQPSQEYEIPTVTRQLMDDKLLTVRVAKTDERWTGMTYQDDLPLAQERLASLVAKGAYPKALW